MAYRKLVTLKMCQNSAVAISSVAWLSVRVHSRPSAARGSIHHLHNLILKSMMTTSKSLVKTSSIGTRPLIRGSACIRLFQQWAEGRNVHFPGVKVPADLLATDTTKTFPFGCANIAQKYARLMVPTILHVLSSAT